MRPSVYRYTRSAGAVAIALIVGLQLVALDARANVSTTYPSGGCQGITTAEEDKLERYGTLFVNITPDPAEIVCPIIKKTSGPGLSNDRILTASVTGMGTSISCRIVDYTVRVVGGGNTLIVGPNVTRSGENYTIPLVGNSTTKFWDGPSNNGKFAYSQLECTMQGYSNITGYTVVESGNNQSGRRITSAANCLPAPTPNTYHYTATGSNPALGGYIEQDGMSFGVTCPALPGAGAKVQIWLGVSVVPPSTTQMGCRRGSGPISYVTGVPEEVKPLVFNSGELYCFQYPDYNNGDGRAFAYRTGPSF